MLDTIFKEKAPNVDWIYIQRSLNRYLTKFLNFWALFIVFITPLILFSYGYSKIRTRVIVFAFCVAVWWLVWLARAAIARDSIQWVKSIASIPALIMIIAIFITSYFSYGLGRIFGLDRIIDPAGPMSWISAIGLILLIAQYARSSIQRLRAIILSYFASSSILALIAIIVWIFSGSHMALFYGSLPSQAIWFSMNLAMIIAAMSSRPKRTRGLWNQQFVIPTEAEVLRGVAEGSLLIRKRFLRFTDKYISLSRNDNLNKISIALHLAILITYDYAPAWILAIAGLAMLVIAQIILQRVFFNANFAKLFILTAFCAVMIFVPLNSLSERFGWRENIWKGVGLAVSAQRYQTQILPTKGLFGVGLGRITQDFWQNAELVDMRSVVNFPLVNNGYVAIFWEAGFLFIAGFFLLVISILVYILRLLKRFSRATVKGKSSRAASIALVALLGLALWLIAFALTVINLIMLLSLGVIIGIITSLSANSERTAQGFKQADDPRGVRVFQFAGNRIQIMAARFVFLAVFALIMLSFSRVALSAKSFSDFQSSISLSKGSFSMDINKAGDIIADNPRIQEFKIVRADFLSKSIINAFKAEPALSFSKIQDRLKVLYEDAGSIEKSKLSASQNWQTAWNIEQIGAILSKMPKSSLITGAKLSNSIIWFDMAKDYYDQAIAILPRNVILFTDVARFLRMASPLKDGAQKEEYLKTANELADKAINIDNTYAQAFIEKAEIYVLLGRSEEALNLIRAYAGESESIAYRAGRIAFTSQKFEEAVGFYNQVLEQNPKHLQARYDIIQSYAALANSEQARSQLNELRALVPKDDIQTYQLLDELGKMIGE